MVSMLEALVEHGSEVPVQYIHGTHDRDTHAMRDHVRALAAKGHAVRVIDFHQTPLAAEVAGRAYAHAGLITEEWLIASTRVGESDYYSYGPHPFLSSAVAA